MKTNTMLAFAMVLVLLLGSSLVAADNPPGDAKGDLGNELLKEFVAVSSKSENSQHLRRTVSITNSTFVISEVDPRNPKTEVEYKIPMTAKRRLSIKIIRDGNYMVMSQPLDGDPFAYIRTFKGNKIVATSSLPDITFRVKSFAQASELANVMKDLWTTLGFDVPYGILADPATEEVGPATAQGRKPALAAKDYLKLEIQTTSITPDPFRTGGNWVVRSTHQSKLIGYRVAVSRGFERLPSVDGEIAPGTTITLGPQTTPSTVPGHNYERIVYSIVSAWFK